MFRLLADDLSGALDSAAPFAIVRGPMPVLVVDRRMPKATPRSTARPGIATSPRLRRAPARSPATSSSAELAFMKIDSVLRGHPAAEIAAVQAGGRFRTVVVAPAFPAQGRITRSGRQLVRRPQGDWSDSGIDLAAGLAARGIEVRQGGAEPGGGTFPVRRRG